MIVADTNILSTFARIGRLDLRLILRRLWQANHCAKEEVRALIEEIEKSEPGMVIKGKDEIFR